MKLIKILFCTVFFNLIVFAQEDADPPTLISIAFSKTIATNNETIAVNLIVEDEISGIAEIALQIRNPYGSQTQYLGNFSNAGANNYSQSFTVPDNAVSGNWFVYFVYLKDHSGNLYTKIHTTADSPATFQVNSTNEDLNAPSLNGISFSKTIVANAETIDVMVSTEDDKTGIQEIMMQIKNPLNNQTQYLGGFNATSQEHTYSQTLVLPYFAVSGTWYVYFVYVKDGAGNIFSGTFNAQNSPATFEVNSSAPDADAPVINAVYFSNSVVGNGATNSLIIDTEDEVSGIAEIGVQIKNPNDNQTVYLGNFANTDGNLYTSSFSIHENAVNGIWYLYFILLKDHAGNQLARSYSKEDSIATFEVNSNLSSEKNMLEPSQVVLYPNPASNQVRIKSRFEFDSGYISDCKGSVLKIYTNLSKTITLPSLKKGVYLITLQSKRSAITKQLLIN